MCNISPLIVLAALARHALAETFKVPTDFHCDFQQALHHEPCCQADIDLLNGTTLALPVCCDGYVFGKSQQTDPPSLLNAFRGVTCCQGERKADDYDDPNVTTCTQGTAVPMASLITPPLHDGRVSQSIVVTTRTSSAGSAEQTGGAANVGAAAAAGVAAFVMGGL